MRIASLLIPVLLILLSCTQKSSTTLQADTLKSDLRDTITPSEIATTENIETIQATPQCSYENEMSDLGIGLIIAPSDFEIFSDSLLTDKFAEVKMYEQQVVDICPIFFKPDYGIMHFVCVSETGNAYKVLIGNTELKYIPKTKTSDLRTWNDYILQSFGIRRQTSLSVYQEPEVNSKTITIPEGQEMFCPMEVKGDWVKVTHDCFYNLENNPHEGEPCHSFIDECDEPRIGWLKWRDQNKLLIDIFLMP